MSDRDILSTYRTKCMLFAFSRSFGDEVKLCSIFADVILSLFKLRFPQFTVQNYKRRGDRIRPMFARDITTASHNRCTSKYISIYSCVYALTLICIVRCVAPHSGECAFFVCARTCEPTWKNDILTLAYVHTDSTNCGQYESRRSMRI